MSEGRTQVGAVPTSLGWVVVSIDTELLRRAAAQLATFRHGEFTVNGVTFTLTDNPLSGKIDG